MNQIYYATITREPKAVTSQLNGKEERMATVDYNGDEYRIYWPAFEGGQDRAANFLQPGDTVALEWTGKKFKLCPQQAPELLKALSDRMIAAKNAAPTPSVPPGAPAAAVPPAVAAAPAQSLEEDCAEMVQTFLLLRRSLASVPDEQIQAMACTIWIQRHRK